MLWKRLKTQKTKQYNELQPEGLLTVARIQQMRNKKIQNNISSLPLQKQLSHNKNIIKDQDQLLKFSNLSKNKIQSQKSLFFSNKQQEQIKDKYGRVTETLYIVNTQGNSNKKITRTDEKQLIELGQEKCRKDSQWDFLQKQQKPKQSNKQSENYEARPSQSQIPFPSVNQPLQKSQSKSVIVSDEKKPKKKRPEDLLLSFQLQSQIQQSEKNVSHKHQRQRQQNSPKTGNFRYSENSFNKIHHHEPVAEFESNSSQMKMDDFFKQLQQAGIDICDEKSEQHKEEQKIPEILKDTQKFKKNVQQQSRQAEQQIIQSNNSGRTLSKKQISFQINYKQQAQRKLRQLRKKICKNLSYLKVMRQQITNIYYILNSFDKEIKNQSSNSIKIFTDLIYKLLINKKNPTNQQNKIIQQLRFQILKLEGQLLQRETINREQIELINDLRLRNQQLTESIFDADQKAAQCDLLIQKKIQLFIANYSPEKPQNSTKLNDNIKKLNQQVQQLTKLYQTSVQQNKKTKLTEMQNIKLQMDKLLLKQQSLLNRQQQLHQQIQKFELRLQKFQEQEHIMNLQKQKLFKKQKELESMEKVISQKFAKIQQLQAQLSDGFNYLEENKRQNQSNAQKQQLQRKQIMKILQQNEKRRKYYEFSQHERRDSMNKRNSLWDSNKNGYKSNQLNSLIDRHYNDHKIISRFEPILNIQNGQRRLDSQNSQESPKFFKSQQQIFNNKISPLHKDIHRYNSMKFYTEDDYSAYAKYQSKQINNKGIPHENSMKNIFSLSPPRKNQNINTQRFYNAFNKFTKESNTAGTHHNLFSPQLIRNKSKNLKIYQSKIYKPENSRTKQVVKKQPFHSNSRLDQIDTKIEVLRNEIKKQISAAKSR